MSSNSLVVRFPSIDSGIVLVDFAIIHDLHVKSSGIGDSICPSSYAVLSILLQWPSNLC